MRWSASAPVTWPADHRWQQLWSEALAPLLARLRVGAGGRVEVEGAGPGDPEVQLVAGEHLQPGAEYRIAPELTTGLLRAWVGATGGRPAGAEWAPYGEPGRAHLEAVGLDRLEEVRGGSTMEHLQGRVRFAPHEPEQALDAEAEVAWLRATVQVGVRDGLLRVEISARGLGVWWPTLAPVFLGGRAAFQRELETAVAELAASLTGLSATGVFELGPAPESLEERQERYARLLREGMDELARRQRTVADAVAPLPWWRRTRGRWRTELAALPPITRSGDGLSYGEDWPGIEEELTTAVLRPVSWRRAERLEASTATFTEALVARRLDFEARVDAAVASAVRTEPWLTDEALDLAWLATPTRILKELS